MKKETAIEWLENEITNRITRRNPHDSIIIQTQGETLIELLEQAKEMEKQQIIDASNESYLNSELIKRSVKNKKVFSVGEQYYNETFKQQ